MNNWESTGLLKGQTEQSKKDELSSKLERMYNLILSNPYGNCRDEHIARFLLPIVSMCYNEKIDVHVDFIYLSFMGYSDNGQRTCVHKSLWEECEYTQDFIKTLKK